jgi:peptide/nickel transport system substrate-binding protein
MAQYSIYFWLKGVKLALYVVCIAAATQVTAQEHVISESPVIFELSKPLEATANFNYLAPPAKISGVYPARREHGARQVMFEPLFHLNLDTGELEPWLGLSVESDAAQRLWTLRLREGVTWSDSMPKTPLGAEAKRYPFTADDVVFTSIKILGNVNLSAYEASRFRAAVEKVEKIDDLTVRFTLRNANPRFAIESFGDTAFGSLMIMPKHIWETQDASKFDFGNPIGTGPYTLKEYTKDKVTYVLDPGWWGAKAAFDLPGAQPDKDGKVPKVGLPEPTELVWRYTEAPETLDLLPKKHLLTSPADGPAIAGAANGAPPLQPTDWLDATREISPKEAKLAIEAGGADQVITWNDPDKPGWNTACARQLEINTQPTVVTEYTLPGETPQTPVQNAWSDPQLRKALAVLIDRTAVGKAYGYTDASVDPQKTWFAAFPSTTMFAAYGSMFPFIQAAEAAGFGLAPTPDPATADALFAAAGYAKSQDGRYEKDGKALTATIAVIDGTPDAAGADALETQLEAAGIDITIAKQPNERYWGWTVPYGRYQIAYGWLSCGSLAEPYTSMKRYAYSPLEQNKDDPTFDNTGRWTVPAAYKDALTAMASLSLRDSADASKPNPQLVANMLEAYKVLNEEMPFIPLVQTPRIIAFNTTHWTGWPTSTTPGNPAHDWGSIHKLLQNLKKVGP